MNIELTQISPIKNQKSKIENPIRVCHLDDLPIGLGRAFDINGKTIALFRTRKGKIFASDNTCPHKGGPLADGMLAGDAVVCPLHTFRFDLATGDCDQPNQCPLKIYPTDLRDDQVFISL